MPQKTFKSAYFFNPIQEMMDPDSLWANSGKALLFVHDLDAKVGHISELMSIHQPDLGTIQVDREAEDAVFVFHKKGAEYFAAGQKWKEIEYEEKRILHQIAHQSIWVPASAGRAPACDFFPRMQALIPNINPHLRDSLLSKLLETPSAYQSTLSCVSLSETPGFRAHLGNGIILLLKNEEDFKKITNNDCILNDNCARRPVPFVSKRDVFVPQLPNLKQRECFTCGAKHKVADCDLQKKFVNCKVAIIQRAMISYYKLGDHLVNYLDPLPEEVFLPDDPQQVQDNTEASPLNTQQDRTSDNLLLLSGSSNSTIVEAPTSKATSSKPNQAVSSSSQEGVKNPKPVKIMKQTDITSFMEENKAEHSHYDYEFYNSFAGGRDCDHEEDATCLSTLYGTEIFNYKVQEETYSFDFVDVPPDGDCFFYALAHSQSPIRGFCPPSAKDIRAQCYIWCLQNKVTFDAVVRASFGNGAAEEVLRRLERDFCWINFPIVILTALTFQIDILVISPVMASNILVSAYCEDNKIPFPLPKAVTILLFHNYGDPYNIQLSTVLNHYALLIPRSDALLSRIAEEINHKLILKGDKANANLVSDSSSSDAENEHISRYPPDAASREDPAKRPCHSGASEVTSLSRPKRKKKRKKRRKRKVSSQTGQPEEEKDFSIFRDTMKSFSRPILRLPEATDKLPKFCECLNILSWNATSLMIPGRLSSLLDTATDCDIVCVQECGLNQAPDLRGFNAELRHSSTKPRGILALIRENISYKRCHDLEEKFDPLECIIIEFKGKSTSWLFVGCYFNPWYKLPVDTLVSALSHLCQLGKPVVVCGDYNSPGFDAITDTQVSRRGTLLSEFLQSSDNMVLISEFDYTFYRGDETRSSLDGVIATLDAASLSHTTLLPPLAPGHLPYIISTHLGAELVDESQISIAAQLQSTFTDWNQFFKTLDLAHFDNFTHEADIVRFLEVVKNAQTAALVHRKERLRNSGWWNDICRQALRDRNKALRKLQKCIKRGSARSFKLKQRKQAYYKAKKKANAIFQREKARWKSWIINQAHSSTSSKIWKAINKICGSKWNRKKTPPTPLKLQQAKDKAEALCSEFESIQSAQDLSSLAATIPEPSFSSSGFPHTEEIAEWEIDKALDKVKVTSSPGADEIKVSTIRRIWAHSKWKSTLHKLINAIYRDPCLFKPFKHAVVHPIPKPGKEGCYRPISLLSQVGKILERILSQRIQRKLFLPNQFGCSPHRSTRDVLLRLQNWAVNASYGALSIFFDVSKAYDRVIPKLVIRKLRELKVTDEHTVSWIYAFLSGRSFQVRLKGQTSLKVGTPLFGLPQGSPLSVVLWKIFAYDIPMHTDDNMFMDDLNYNIEEYSYEEAEETANERLALLDSWAKLNGVLFDKKKTKVLVHQSCTEVHLKFHRSDISCIPLVTSYKYLGTWLGQRNDVDLGFSLDIQFRAERIEFTRRSAWIRRLARGPIYLRRTAYLALVRSKFAYSLCLTIRNYADELEKLQSKALLLISDACPGTPAERLRAMLSIPSVLDLAKSQAITTRARMLAFGGLLAADYTNWIVVDEGKNSLESPFGLIQSESLVSAPGLYFQGYTQFTTSQHAILWTVQFNSFSINDALEGENMYLCFTDGSYMADLSVGGIGVYWPRHPASGNAANETSLKIFPVWSSYICELLAIREALRQARKFRRKVSFKEEKTLVVIFSDCLSAISALQGLRYSPTTNLFSPLFNEITNLMIDLPSNYELHICWVKGHAGIEGNEIADSLAKAAISQQSARETCIDISYFKAKANAVKKTPEYVSRLLRQPLQHYIKKAIINHSDPRTGTTILRILCDHYFLKGNQFQRQLNSAQKPKKRFLRKLSSPKDLPVAFSCRFCAEHPETVEHVVNYCSSPEVEYRRFALRQKSWMYIAGQHQSLLQALLSAPQTWPHLKNFFISLHISP
jgi:ribonuclease HI